MADGPAIYWGAAAAPCSALPADDWSEFSGPLTPVLPLQVT